MTAFHSFVLQFHKHPLCNISILQLGSCQISLKSRIGKKLLSAGADPGFDQGGGPQIVTGLKLPFWGLSFVEFLVLGPHFWWSGGGPGPPPLDPPLVSLQGEQTDNVCPLI